MTNSEVKGLDVPRAGDSGIRQGGGRAGWGREGGKGACMHVSPCAGVGGRVRLSSIPADYTDRAACFACA